MRNFAAFLKTVALAEKQQDVAGNALRLTPELRRIAALPRRDWEETEYNLDFSQWKKAPGFDLWPHQRAALAEIARLLGGFFPLRVGGGKTLICFLAPTVIGAKSTMIVVPGSLREKTEREFAELAEYWQSPINCHIVTYEEISRSTGQDLLEKYWPSLIILDECHKVKNMDAACTRKLRALIEDAEPCVVAMTGTAANEKLSEFAHIVRWALHENSPVPESSAELELWDKCFRQTKHFDRRNITYLTTLGEKSKVQPSAKASLRIFARRFHVTPGIVATSGVNLDVKLFIHLHRKDPPAEVTHAILQATAGILPNGEQSEFTDIQRLEMGFFFRWTKRPPAAWLQARGRWNALLFETIAKDQAGLESPLLVMNAALRSDLGGDAQIVAQDWRDIRKSFNPIANRECVWYSDHAIQAVKEQVGDQPAIVWVNHKDFGRRLQAELGWSYYGAQGKNSLTGQAIEQAPTDRPIVASIAANRTGRNLQHWTRQVLAELPGKGEGWEQLLGRLYRSGQKQDVNTDVLLWPSSDVPFAKAKTSARWRTEQNNGTPDLLILGLQNTGNEK